jgi:hypothetical protein
VLGFAVPGRAFLLCWSMQLLDSADRDRLIFGPYFLVPFGLAVALLLLEGGLALRRRGAIRAALVLPAGLAFLAMVGHRQDPIYQGFLDVFRARLGCGPLFLTVVAAAGFYAYAALRRVSSASLALTAALVVLAIVGRDTLNVDELIPPQPEPILAAALLQLGLGLWRRNAWLCLLGTGLAADAALALPAETAFRGAVAFHLVLLGVWVVGAAFNDPLGRILRGAGAGMALLACLVVTFSPPGGVPPGVAVAYPLVLAASLVAYGLWLRHRPSYVAAGLALGFWLAASAWTGYRAARHVVAGLDQIALSLALFGVAVLVSLGKAGALSRWVAALRGTAPALDSREGRGETSSALLGGGPEVLNVQLGPPREVRTE